MEKTEERIIAAGNHNYRGHRATDKTTGEGYVSFAELAGNTEVGRISMAADGSMTIDTFGAPLPRAAVEKLIELADWGLAIGH